MEFIKKYKRIIVSILGILIGISIVFVIYFINNKEFEPISTTPSYNSDSYKEVIGEQYLKTEKTGFIVLGKENTYISESAPIIEELKSFTNEYVNMLKNKQELDINKFMINKYDGFEEAMEEDLDNNEFFYIIDFDNFNVISDNYGYISTDGNTAVIQLVIEFKVLNKKDIPQDFLEDGKTYTQLREFKLQRVKDGSLKISEQYISMPEEKK